MGMDSILAIGVGLGLRALIDNVTDQNITAAALVGIWEGVVLNHFLLKYRHSFDPYIAFGFRLFVDFMFTESFARMTMTVMWAFLGMVFADLGGDLTKDRRFRRIWRRVRHTFPFLSSLSRSRHSSSRVRFTSGASSSSASSPQLPLRPTATPFPGTFDQWSVASSEIGGPTRSIASGSSSAASAAAPPAPRVRSPLATVAEIRRPESTRRDSRRADSVHTLRSEASTRRTEAPVPARSPSELEYLNLPAIPDPEPSPIEPRFRDEHEHEQQPINSGLTTPNDDPSSRHLPDEDRPVIHSGLTTPDRPYTTIMPTSEGLPPVRVTSDAHEGTPTRSQVELAPIPIRPRSTADLDLDLEVPGPSVPFPEPHVPTIAELAAGSQSQQPAAGNGLGLVPSISEIPIIPTPSFDTAQEKSQGSRPQTLVDPPPQYEEPIKDVPDNVSVTGESVISETSRSAIINKADELRKQAQTHEKAKSDYKIALDRAKREKRHWDVLWYEGEIEDAETRAKTLNAKAAHRYFKAHNLKPEPQTIDVHRLNVNEAVIEVKRALRDARGDGAPELRIITGRGKHSKNNIPVLKKALIQEFLKYEIEAKSEPGNPGVLVITIPQLTLAGNAEPSSSAP